MGCSNSTSINVWGALTWRYTVILTSNVVVQLSFFKGQLTRLITREHNFLGTCIQSCVRWKHGLSPFFLFLNYHCTSLFCLTLFYTHWGNTILSYTNYGMQAACIHTSIRTNPQRFMAINWKKNSWNDILYFAQTVFLETNSCSLLLSPSSHTCLFL